MAQESQNILCNFDYYDLTRPESEYYLCYQAWSHPKRSMQHVLLPCLHLISQILLEKKNRNYKVLLRTKELHPLGNV